MKWIIFIFIWKWRYVWHGLRVGWNFPYADSKHDDTKSIQVRVDASRLLKRPINDLPTGTMRITKSIIVKPGSYLIGARIVSE